MTIKISKASTENGTPLLKAKSNLGAGDWSTMTAEEKSQFLFNSIKDYGIYLIDPTGNILSWNVGAEKIKGHTAAEIIGKNFSTFFLPDDIQRQHPLFGPQQASLNNRYEEESWRLRKNGTKFWANIIITPVKNENGEVTGFINIIRDLTEKKIAEDKLKFSEERARKMIEGIQDYAMIMLNPDGTVANWNEGARRIKGYEAHEVVGKYFSLFYPEQDIQIGKCEYELAETIQTGRFEDEGWRIRKDGTKFWASVLITAIRDPNGQLLGFSKVTRDFTDRKRADDLLKMAYTGLEKRVAERTQQLLKSNQKLEEAIKVRDDFLSIASHELRTPLTPLKMQIQSLLSIVKNKKLDHTSSDRLLRMVQICDTSLSRLSALLENLVDVSRINSGKLTLNHEIFDLQEMGQNLIKRYQNEIMNSGSILSFDTEQPVIGSFDQLRMEQVFSNLLMNAIKYGAHRPIHIAIFNLEGVAHIVFKDDGIGINKKDHIRIFERFERVESHSNAGGLGLGLYISRQIVEAHGGEINVENGVDAGTVFTVKIPIRIIS